VYHFICSQPCICDAIAFTLLAWVRVRDPLVGAQIKGLSDATKTARRLAHEKEIRQFRHAVAHTLFCQHSAPVKEESKDDQPSNRTRVKAGKKGAGKEEEHAPVEASKDQVKVEKDPVEADAASVSKQESSDENEASKDEGKAQPNKEATS